MTMSSLSTGQAEQLELEEAGLCAQDRIFPVSRIPAVNVATIPQRSPLRYPGGKTWLIPHIREWLQGSRPNILIEPFAGGGIVSLTAAMEGLVKQAIMIELDHDVAAFWHAALRSGKKLATKVANFEPTLETLHDWEQTGPKSVNEHGFRTLVLNRTRRAGILAGGASFMRSGENGKGLLSRWYPDTLAKRLRAIAAYADHIAFYEGDGTQLLGPLLQGWGSQAAIFVDPPYTAGGKRAGSRLYRDSCIDHEALFDLLAKHQSNFLMTYDASPEVMDLICKHGFHAVSVVMKNAHHNPVPELIITRENVFS